VNFDELLWEIGVLSAIRQEQLDSDRRLLAIEEHYANEGWCPICDTTIGNGDILHGSECPLFGWVPVTKQYKALRKARQMYLGCREILGVELRKGERGAYEVLVESSKVTYLLPEIEGVPIRLEVRA